MRLDALFGTREYHNHALFIQDETEDSRFLVDDFFDDTQLFDDAEEKEIKEAPAKTQILEIEV